MQPDTVSRPTLSDLVSGGKLEPIAPNVVPIPKRMCRPLPGERTGQILLFTGVTRTRYTDVAPPCDVWHRQLDELTRLNMKIATLWWVAACQWPFLPFYRYPRHGLYSIKGGRA
jgi:hypothetical protein